MNQKFLYTPTSKVNVILEIRPVWKLRWQTRLQAQKPKLSHCQRLSLYHGLRESGHEPCPRILEV